MENKKDGHKATIETIINTAALTLTAFGVNCILIKDYYGFIVIIFGMGLEFLKYWGRHNKYW
jgi:hypothetical protein